MQKQIHIHNIIMYMDLFLHSTSVFASIHIWFCSESVTVWRPLSQHNVHAMHRRKSLYAFKIPNYSFRKFFSNSPLFSQLFPQKLSPY